MYNIIPLIIALISLSVTVYIVSKKFSALASLDVESIQSEREAMVKERIIGKKLKRKFMLWWTYFSRIIDPVFRSTGKGFKWLYAKLTLLKENYKKDQPQTISDPITVKDKLSLEAEDFIKNGDLEGAERKLIEIIGLDSQEISAFIRLGKLYSERKNFDEAEQTFEHILKLCEAQNKDGCDIANILYDIATVNEAKENFDRALENIKKSLKIEPNNPRYLDMALRISIIKKDKITALDVFNKLMEVNPENQKLVDFKKQIDEI
jgi:tetratricopeptide (TPR) repeat protein